MNNSIQEGASTTQAQLVISQHGISTDFEEIAYVSDVWAPLLYSQKTRIYRSLGVSLQIARIRGGLQGFPKAAELVARVAENN